MFIYIEYTVALNKRNFFVSRICRMTIHATAVDIRRTLFDVFSMSASVKKLLSGLVAALSMQTDDASREVPGIEFDTVGCDTSVVLGFMQRQIKANR